MVREWAVTKLPRFCRELPAGENIGKQRVGKMNKTPFIHCMMGPRVTLFLKLLAGEERAVFRRRWASAASVTVIDLTRPAEAVGILPVRLGFCTYQSFSDFDNDRPMEDPAGSNRLTTSRASERLVTIVAGEGFGGYVVHDNVAEREHGVGSNKIAPCDILKWEKLY